MSLIGLLVAAGSLLLLVPLLPFLAVLKVIDLVRGGDRAGRLRRRADHRASTDERPRS